MAIGYQEKALNDVETRLVATLAANQQITRQRYIELVELADKCVRWLEDNGLKQGEQCEFCQIAERLWFAPK